MVARDQAIHLLQRTEFVARPERVDQLVAQPTLEAAVDDVLSVTETDVAFPAELAVHAEGGANWPQYQLAVHWWFERMVRQSARPVQEKMTLFWHGHFCSDWGKVFDTPAMLHQNKLFRDHGTTGNVRELARAMAVQPAMLLYLDNADNTKRSPNQNFARELLELFLLGVGNYTEADVEACTLAWTGHNLDWRTHSYVFRPEAHAYGAKTLLGRTADFDGPGTQGPGVIDHVLGPDGTVTVGPHAGAPTRWVAARFLSRKLWEAFAFEAPSAEIVEALASALVGADFAITPWVRTMLLRPEFHSPMARSGRVRPPTDYIAAILYHTGLAAADVHPEWSADDMGQALFRPPNVSGWRVNRYWVNASAMAARASFASHVRWRLVDGRGDSDPLALRSGTWTWEQLDALSPVDLVDTLAAAFQVALTPSSRSSLVAWAQGEINRWGSVDWWRSPNALLLMMLTPEQHVA